LNASAKAMWSSLSHPSSDALKHIAHHICSQPSTGFSGALLPSLALLDLFLVSLWSLVHTQIECLVRLKSKSGKWDFIKKNILHIFFIEKYIRYQ
jgi:hypothetical protein